MGAYNRFRGDQCCESPYLLTSVLKEDWGFQGFTISDFMWGIRDTEKAAAAGLDIEMPAAQDYGKKLLKAVEEGSVAEEFIDESAFRVARTILKFETAPDPLPDYPEQLIGSQEHINLALEAAEKSMVLMQNNHQVLPFDPQGVSEVLVLGTLANEENIGDHGSSQVIPEYVVTPLEGLQELYGDQISFIYDTGDDLDKVKGMASSADAVIFVVGYTHSDEGEYISNFGNEVGGDRVSLRLHDNESRLLREVGPLNEHSVAVLIGGSAILVEEWKNQVNGIIHAFYPGMEGGTAIAETIFGKVNPGGKLPFTVASNEDHYPGFDRLAEEVTYDRYHGYIKLDHEGHHAAYPFGFGLSYTTFSHDSAVVHVMDSIVEVSVKVTNTGNRSGDQVVQLYIGYDGSAVEREHKLLKGFQRISLDPGETANVTLICPFTQLSWYNPASDQWELEKMEYQAYIGSSSDEKDLIKTTFIIE
jgi:beta-glucosidase